MTGSAALRVLLAACLVLWTPAWCCCALRGGLGPMAGVANATCGATGCGSSSAQNASTPRAAEHSCCEGEQPSDEPSSDAPCRCREIGSDRVRFDTSAKILLPPLSLAFLNLPLPVHATFDLPRDPFALPVSSRLDLPPPTSLLAQHCLLII